MREEEKLAAEMGISLPPTASDSDEPIHMWFGLTYASYFVMPRSVLQAMPLQWQRRFVLLMQEAEDAGVEVSARYAVNARDLNGRFYRDPLAQYRRPHRRAVNECLGNWAKGGLIDGR